MSRAFFALLFVFASCAEPQTTGPFGRVAQFADCQVPAGAIGVEDRLVTEGDDVVFHARVVLRPSRLPRMLRSCGVTLDDFRRGFDPSVIAPPVDPPAEHSDFPVPDPRVPQEGQPVDWWAFPSDEHVAHAFVDGRHLLIVQRDTDVAVFLARVPE